MIIEDLSNCSGCSACFSSCSKNAISMIANNEVFLYPKIDKSLCINCKKCEKVCPILNSKRWVEKTPKVYAAVNKNEEIQKNSSSGGVFFALAEYVIKNNGIVFGAKFNENFEVIHSHAEILEDVKDFCTSKYVQSKIEISFLECKNFLDDGRFVLFSGTPCQINGLKSYLNKNYENLICVDSICHGVPSPKFWKLYKDHLEKTFSSKITKFTFRNKNEGWQNYSLVADFLNGDKYLCSANKNSYMKIFLKDYCLRNSCYDCFSKEFNRKSDITLADFWGIQNLYPKLFEKNGVSAIFVNNEKGQSALEKVSDSLQLTEVDFEKIVQANPSYFTSVKVPTKRECFFEDLENKSFEKVINKYGKTSVLEKAFKLCKRIIRKLKRICFSFCKGER